MYKILHASVVVVVFHIRSTQRGVWRTLPGFSASRLRLRLCIDRSVDHIDMHRQIDHGERSPWIDRPTDAPLNSDTAAPTHVIVGMPRASSS